MIIFSSFFLSTMYVSTDLSCRSLSFLVVVTQSWLLSSTLIEFSLVVHWIFLSPSLSLSVFFLSRLKRELVKSRKRERVLFIDWSITKKKKRNYSYIHIYIFIQAKKERKIHIHRRTWLCFSFKIDDWVFLAPVATINILSSHPLAAHCRHITRSKKKRKINHHLYNHQ